MRNDGTPLVMPSAFSAVAAGASPHAGACVAVTAFALRFETRAVAAPRAEDATERCVASAPATPSSTSHARLSQKSPSYGTACRL